MTVLASYVDRDAYTEAIRKGEIPRPESCPFCGSRRVWFNGFYARYAHFHNGGEVIRERIRIQRCRCPSCDKRWSLLPGFCLPRKQFGAETVEWALMESCVKGQGDLDVLRGVNMSGPSERTIRRWMRWLPALVWQVCLGKTGREPSPSCRKSVADVLSVLRDWWCKERPPDAFPLRACIHSWWESIWSLPSPLLGKYPMVAR